MLSRHCVEAHYDGRVYMRKLDEILAWERLISLSTWCGLNNKMPLKIIRWLIASHQKKSLLLINGQDWGEALENHRKRMNGRICGASWRHLNYPTVIRVVTNVMTRRTWISSRARRPTSCKGWPFSRLKNAFFSVLTVSKWAPWSRSVWITAGFAGLFRAAVCKAVLPSCYKVSSSTWPLIGQNLHYLFH